MRHEKNFNRLFHQGVVLQRDMLGRERSRKLMLCLCFFFMACWPMFMNLWNKREHSLMIVYYCNLQKIGTCEWAPERTAKDEMGQVHQSPAKSPRLWPHFYGENLSFSSLLPPFLLLLLLLKWGDEAAIEFGDFSKFGG